MNSDFFLNNVRYGCMRYDWVNSAGRDLTSFQEKIS